MESKIVMRCVFIRLQMKKGEEGFMVHLLVVFLLVTTTRLALKRVILFALASSIFLSLS